MAEPALADVVVLAAGRSARLGQPKGLVVVRGRRWIDVQIDAIRAGIQGRIVVVLGPDRTHYEEAVPDLADRVLVEVNPDPDRGPFSSLQCGLARLEPAGRTFVLPVDVPAPEPRVWKELVDGLGTGPTSPDAAAPAFEGRGGHPVLLAPRMLPRLLACAPSSRLDAELRGNVKVVRVPVDDPRVRMNLNTREDWGKLDTGG